MEENSEDVDSEALEIKYIDSEDFVRFQKERQELKIRWIDGFETIAPKWEKLLSGFLAPLPHTVTRRIWDNYARILSVNGAETVLTIARTADLRIMAPKKVETTGNLPILLKKCSDLRREENLTNYVANCLMKFGLDSVFNKLYMRKITSSRLSSFHLFHEGYYEPLEILLSNHLLLRIFRYCANKKSNDFRKHPGNSFLTVDLFSLTPHASLMAIQCILADWNCKIQQDKIIQIAHANTLQMRSLHVKGDGFSVLCEALCTSLARNFHVAQQEIEDFDEIMVPTSTFPPAKERFLLWKLISKFERNFRSANPQSFLINAQRLEDEAENMGEECGILVETACKIRKLCGNQEEEIIHTITSTVSRYPSLGPRMLILAEKCKISYEIDVLLQQLCDPPEDSHSVFPLHPSELIWLKFVEKEIESIGKYGSVRRSLQKLLKVMFEFLDFDTNRFNPKAWKLMKKVLEMSDPSFVQIEWENRRDWWLEYHRTPSKDGRFLKKKAKKRKEEILEALEQLTV